jgi:DNA polymerase-4
MKRSIVHWDGDRFFASIEQAADQRLRNRPVAVGGANRGVIFSASAEARKYGVKPGLPTGKAKRLCAALTVVPAHFDLYERFSGHIVGLCQERSPLVEPVAVGAAFLARLSQI